MRYKSCLSRSRTGSFHFRLRLPARVAASIGVREIRRSLATRDVIEARKRALEAFQAIRRSAEDQASVDSPDVLEGLLQRWRPKPQPVVPVRKPRTIKVGIEHFLRENAHLWTPKTAQEMKAVLGRLSTDQRFGRDEAIAHREALAHLNPRTQNKHLGRLRRLFGFLRHHGCRTGDNPFDGLEVRVRPVSRASDSRSAWSDADCVRLAATGRWLCLLGLYTGARINELAQLRIADIAHGCQHDLPLAQCDIEARRFSDRLDGALRQRELVPGGQLGGLGGSMMRVAGARRRAVLRTTRPACPAARC